ncbi:MAG: hypothetical protein JWR34_4805 [Mycobacterium sp.]|nr:hypothetical protein [Mycobacterium sp.]
MFTQPRRSVARQTKRCCWSRSCGGGIRGDGVEDVEVVDAKRASREVLWANTSRVEAVAVR